MTTTRVLLPVLKGKISFVVDRGRHWSVIEHLILDALARGDWTTDDLASQGNMPRRVVIEAIVRLMRAGWVELAIDSSSVRFRATSFGTAAASNVELPRVTDLRRRPTNYILDMVSGEIFRNRDLVTLSEEEMKKNLGDEPSVWIEPSSWHSNVDVAEALDILLDPEETFVSGQPGGINRRWVSVVVRDGVIVSGLPESRPLSRLRRVVLDAAAEAGNEAHVTVTPDEPSGVESSADRLPSPRRISFDVSDLVLGGEQHRKVLSDVLQGARTTVFIHSTFISAARVKEWVPQFADAVERGVRIHIFWGQNEDIEEHSSTREAIASLRRDVEIRRLSNGITFHPFSTGSHAKVLLADSGEAGAFVAVLGSCNWLTSGFTAYEASVILRDTAAVREVASLFAKLVCMHDGIWSELATEMARINVSLSEVPPTSATSGAEATIVIGAQHNHFVLKARDEATKRIVLASHRLGVASRPGVLVPLQRAAANREVEVEVFYCRRTAPVKARDERSMVDEAATVGVELQLVESPRVHAKFLVWDDSDVLITSLNWLSADQTSFASLGEIGVHIHAPGVGQVLIEHFHRAVGVSA